MRIDKFLSCVNLVKRRTIAQDMIKSNVVYMNGKLAKGSREVKVGDQIEIRYLKETKRYEVLDVPTLKSVPKSHKELYVKELA